MKNMLQVFASLAFMVATAASAGDKFVLSSRSFANGGNMSLKHATTKVLRGKNISPALSWWNPPKGTKSFVLLCVDTNPIAHRWVHWMVVDIPANFHILKLGASPKGMPKGAIELKNSFGNTGWGGPQPPRGTGVHKYVFTVYALNVATLEISKGTALSEKELLAKLKGRVLGKTVLVGLFER